MISFGFKLYKEGHLVNKMGSNDANHWQVKKPTCSLVEVVEHTFDVTLKKLIPARALFCCKQTGELVTLKCKVA